jgi:class 3 adenylate cyclase
MATAYDRPMARGQGGDGPEPGTVTLLFTDLVGSTELFARLGDDAAEQVRKVHFRLLRQEVTSGWSRR